MKVTKKFADKAADFSQVDLSLKDDDTLSSMKDSLSLLHVFFSKKLAEGDMDVEDAGPYAQICESFVRIVEEQRKRQMLKAYTNSYAPRHAPGK